MRARRRTRRRSPPGARTLSGSGSGAEIDDRVADRRESPESARSDLWRERVRMTVALLAAVLLLLALGVAAEVAAGRSCAVRPRRGWRER